MSNPRRKQALEAKLTAQQKKAVYLLIENELLPTKEQRKQDEIAKEVGVTYKTIWSWSTKNQTFIDYKNLIADDYLSAERNNVYARLMSLINGPQPSVKAIDLYLRRFGLLTDKTIVEQDTGQGSRSDEDLAQELEDLTKLLEEKE